MFYEEPTLTETDWAEIRDSVLEDAKELPQTTHLKQLIKTLLAYKTKNLSKATIEEQAFIAETWGLLLCENYATLNLRTDILWQEAHRQFELARTLWSKINKPAITSWYHLGIMAYSEMIAEQNSSLAFEYLSKVIEYPFNKYFFGAHLHLGIMHYGALGTALNHKMGRRLFTIAHAQNKDQLTRKRAAIFLGEMSYWGIATKKDQKRAWRYFLEAQLPELPEYDFELTSVQAIYTTNSVFEITGEDDRRFEEKEKKERLRLIRRGKIEIED
jgi:hypothetical protein